jgi:hypothetical protein
LSERMASPELASNYPKLQELHGRSLEVRESLDRKFERWRELSEREDAETDS